MSHPTLLTPSSRDIAAPDPRIVDFLALIEHGRSERAIDLALERIRQGETVTGVVERLLAPAQRLVGERWHRGVYTVADEHVASGVVDDILGLLRTHTPTPYPEHTVALVCAEGEWHTTPARMAALCLRDAGWRVQFLGGSLPADHLAASLPHVAPRAVAISCTLPLALAGVPALIDASHNEELPVLAGGIGFGPDDRRARHLGADGHAPDIASAAEVLTGWLDRPPTAPPPPARTAVARERAALAAIRTDLVDATCRTLEQRLPALATDDDGQRRHTRQDLDSIVRFLDVTLLVDDPRVFVDFTTWLRDLLAARGVAAGALQATLDALAKALPADLTHAHLVLDDGVAVLEVVTEPASRV